MAEKTTHRFLLEVESSIVHANREAIHERLGPLSRSRFLELTHAVARIRADYLHAAFHSNWSSAEGLSADVVEKRNRYEEALAAYEALERAVERGYIEFTS